MLLYSHDPLSQGAKRLARELGIRRIRHTNSLFRAHRGRAGPWVVNWGASELPGWGYRLGQQMRILNAPEAVQRVSNKLTFFQNMEGRGLTPAFCTEIGYAKDIINYAGCKVVCRTLLNASGGRGIVIASTIEELVDAPLYVQYMPKKAEYRVHIFNSRIIDLQQKVRRQGVEPINWQIRSRDNGFIFQRDNINVPICVIAAAENAMELTDLHFGAVDVIYNERQDRAYVLEINTAPGLEGQTVLSYAQAIRDFTGE